MHGIREVHHGGFDRDDQAAQAEHGGQLEEVFLGAEQMGARQVLGCEQCARARQVLGHDVDHETRPAPGRLGLHCADQFDDAVERPAALDRF